MKFNKFYHFANKINKFFILKPFAKFIVKLNRLVFSCDIPLNENIDRSVFFAHNALGCVISSKSIIKGNVKIFHNVTVGQNRGKYPIIEENVIVYPGAIIVGNICVGHDSTIGANVVLTKSCPPFSIISSNSTFSKSKDQIL